MKKITLASFLIFICAFHFLSTQTISYREQNGELLRTFSIKGDMNWVRDLIKRGDVYVDSMDRIGFTALMYAALYGHVEIMEFLLTERDRKALEADINLAGEANGFTPLMMASMNGKLPAVKFLIARGAILNVEDKNGFTALMFAAGNNHFEVVRCLVEKGADTNIQGKDKWTALKWAEARGFNDIAAYLKSKNRH
jgi:ankyrin repeat protein